MEWVAAAISMVGAVAVAWLGKRSSQAAEKVRATAAPYDALAERVATLEAQVDRMRRTNYDLSRDLDLAADALHELVEWVDLGAHPPPRTVSDHVREVVRRRRESRAE